MSEKSRLIIIGAGGHGRVAAEIAEATGRFDAIGFADDALPGRTLRYPYWGDCEWAFRHAAEYAFFVAIGNAEVRERITRRLDALGARLETLIHPAAVVSPSAVIGPGTVVMPGAIVNADAVISRSVILNTGSSVDHDCVVGDYCHVSVGAHLCGTVQLGAHTWIGAGATVINNISICGGCMIGAGAVVVKHIADCGVYKGVPARKG